MDWVLTVVAALAVLELNGALVRAHRSRRPGLLVGVAADRPHSMGLRRATCDPLTWAPAHLNTALGAGDHPARGVSAEPPAVRRTNPQAEGGPQQQERPVAAEPCCGVRSAIVLRTGCASMCRAAMWGSG